MVSSKEKKFLTFLKSSLSAFSLMVIAFWVVLQFFIFLPTPRLQRLSATLTSDILVCVSKSIIYFKILYVI